MHPCAHLDPIEQSLDLTPARITCFQIHRVGGSTGHRQPQRLAQRLARSLAARGTYLRAGEIVLTGSLVETKWLQADDDVRVTVTGLGELAFRVV